MILSSNTVASFLLLLILGWVGVHNVVALPSYNDRLPNGYASKRAGSGLSCQELGHLQRVEAAPRNQFGLDFAAAGRQWTEALCNKDSDGDGLTNGQELGDPCCTWTMTNGAQLRLTDLSDPGVATSVNSATTSCFAVSFASDSSQSPNLSASKEMSMSTTSSPSSPSPSSTSSTPSATTSYSPTSSIYSPMPSESDSGSPKANQTSTSSVSVTNHPSASASASASDSVPASLTDSSTAEGPGAPGPDTPSSSVSSSVSASVSPSESGKRRKRLCEKGFNKLSKNDRLKCGEVEDGKTVKVMNGFEARVVLRRDGMLGVKVRRAVGETPRYLMGYRIWANKTKRVKLRKKEFKSQGVVEFQDAKSQDKIDATWEKPIRKYKLSKKKKSCCGHYFALWFQIKFCKVTFSEIDQRPCPDSLQGKSKPWTTKFKLPCTRVCNKGKLEDGFVPMPKKSELKKKELLCASTWVCVAPESSAEPSDDPKIDE